MKKVMFISILLISILFISSCELFVPGGRSPQFAQIYIPQEVRNPGGGCSDKAINRIDCSEIAPPYGGGCTIGIPEGYVTFVCGDNPEDESIPYCGVGMCTIPEFMCTYLEEETNCHCGGDEPPEPDCPDGLINQDWEECDCGQNGCIPQELDYQTCEGLGHAGGVLSCTNGCQFDESGCHDCFSDDCDGVCPAECAGLGMDPDCNCDSNNDCCGNGCLNPPDTDCDLIPGICGNGVVEPGSAEQCDIDVNSYVPFDGPYFDYKLGNFQTYDFSGVCPTSEPCAACMACDMDISLDSQTCQCTDSRGHIGDKVLVENNDVGTPEVGEMPEDLCQFYNEALCLAHSPECKWVDAFCGGGLGCMCDAGGPGCCEDINCCYDWGCNWIPASCWVDSNVQDYIGSWYALGFVLRGDIEGAVYEGILPSGWGDWTEYFIPNDLGGKYYDDDGDLVLDLTELQDYVTG